MTALVWLTRDLRLADHPPLRAALAAHEHVVPVFCLDDRLLHGRHRSATRTAFLLESLAALDAALAERGGGLVVRHGPPERELPALARDAGASEVYVSADAGPFARARLARVERALGEQSVRLRPRPGLFVADDIASIETQAGGPYSVFSPFERRWRELPLRAPLDAPARVALAPGVARTGVPGLRELGLGGAAPDAARGGERAGRERLDAFLAGGVGDYHALRQDLGADATSRLSAYLHLGCLSALEIEARLPRGAGPDEFRRSLAWRDFYAHVLRHNPANAELEFQARYRGTLDWRADSDLADAWREGLTGYPLVDAAMRQLRREGYMPNRARLIAGSFLTKDLGLDWRIGERHFMSLLADGDEASNNGNWQWIASVGVDPAPVWRRLYNPTRHAARYDPDGAYLRRHVDELRDVPDEHLAEPWKMPPALQRRCGCVIGRDYPAPIVDHAAARADALERYRAALETPRRPVPGASETLRDVPPARRAEIKRL